MRRQCGAALAIFVLIVAALAGAFLLSQMLSGPGKRLDDSTRMNATFETLHEALARFSQLNKRLPCPAIGTSSTGIADPQTATATCTTTASGIPGVVPWVTLGLPTSSATDQWGRLISYRVFDGATGFTRADGLGLDNCLDSDVTVVYPLDAGACNAASHENTRSDFFAGKGISVNDRGSAIEQVAYALISHGETGLGAFIPNSATPTGMPAAGSSELLNAGIGGTYWILPHSDSAVGVNQPAHFDDLVSYASASALALKAGIGGRPWPLYVLLDRTNTTGSSAGAMNTGASAIKIAVSNGPIAVTAFSSGPPRHICVTVPTATTSVPYAIAPCNPGGGGDTLTNTNSEGLSFDFRIRRKYLKILLTDLDATESAQLTFYDGATQIAQTAVAGCVGNTAGIRKVDVTGLAGKEFTRVDVTAVGSADFSVASISACSFDDQSLYPDCKLLPEPLPELFCP